MSHSRRKLIDTPTSGLQGGGLSLQPTTCGESPPPFPSRVPTISFAVKQHVLEILLNLWAIYKFPSHSSKASFLTPHYRVCCVRRSMLVCFPDGHSVLSSIAEQLWPLTTVVNGRVTKECEHLPPAPAPVESNKMFLAAI